MGIEREAVDRLLTTTRTVRRRLDFDRPVPRELISECIDIALQAPASAHPEHWSGVGFVVVTDPERKGKIAEYYRVGMNARVSTATTDHVASDDPQAQRFGRVYDSSMYLADNLEQVPALVLPVVRGHITDEPKPVQAATFGSVLPAAWSFMLAARARGLGTAWTTVHLFHEQQIADLLGIPPGWSQAVLLPVAYYKGADFKPAVRPPAAEVTHWDSW